ncbi:hypothetical protein MHU86_23838 [Fragilaria crotonensis]|nr:hypothetical protein MHU86_23838 [Fragilaria crotonensis]
MRLQSIEQQFTRIDEFDKKLAAVSDKVEKATEQIEKSGELQKHISADMEEMKVLTEKQFTEMNNRLLTNMECQHKMSTTMLDLHAHFEKLSAFMEGLATKMEFDREPGPITAVASMDKPPSKSVLSQRHVTDLCSTSSASSASGSSQSNAQSVTSSASSKVYCSPEKKKQRSHRKLGNKKQQHDHSHQVYSSNDSPGCNSEVELMEVCTNLDEAFDSPDIISSPAQVNLPPHDPSMSPVLTQPTPYPLPAPLDSQYTYPSDQAGATEA